jgi:hypothetical protein
VIREIQASGVKSLRGGARALAARGVPTTRGGEWSPVNPPHAGICGDVVSEDHCNRRHADTLPGNPSDKPDVVWIPDVHSLKRILDEIAKTPQGKKLIQKVDRNVLAGDLSDAWGKWLLWRALDSTGGAKRRAKLFRTLEISATKFKKRLLDKTGEYYVLREMMFSAFSDETAFGLFLTSLDRVIKVASQKMNEKKAWLRLKRSPRGFFAYEVLGPVYKKNFGEDPAAWYVKESRNAPARPDTPFIRFAVQVMKEMGIGGGPDLVLRAFKEVKAGRPGRRQQ